MESPTLLWTALGLAVLIAPIASASEVNIDFLGIQQNVHMPIAAPDVALSTPQPQQDSAPREQTRHSSTPLISDLRLPPPLIVVDFAPVQALLPEVPLQTTSADDAGAQAPANAPMERHFVGHTAPATSTQTQAQVSLAALATVAAVGAAAPTSMLSWDRLRRLAFAAALYTRIAKDRLLDHGARDALLTRVRASPGISLGDAAQAANIPRNTAVYHLRRLEKEGLVTSTVEGRSRLFFAPGSLDQLPKAAAVAALRHPMTADIATEVGASPGVDQQALCARFGLAPSLAHWHATRLVESGIVTRARDGRHVRYYPGPEFGLVRSRS